MQLFAVSEVVLMNPGKKVLAFDVYGTLIDTDGVLQALRAVVGEKASTVMNTWRSKQLEYTFRRGLMRRYADFSVCTKQALDFACRSAQVELTEAEIAVLLRTYDTLPAYPDATSGLLELSGIPNIRKYAFSNGLKADVEKVLKNAGLIDFFDGVISVDEVKSFKPDPVVYRHLISSVDSPAERTWLISGNSFDVIGAKSAGLGAIWLRRAQANILDSWEYKPDAVIGSIEEISGFIAASESDNGAAANVG